MRVRKAARLKTFGYRGLHRYSLTICTDRRRQIFASAEVALLTTSQISRSACDHEFAILQYSGFHYARLFGGRLWQRYSAEHVLRNDEKMATHARYILENPVRAGLARSVEEYPFLGSKVCALKDLLEGTARSG